MRFVDDARNAIRRALSAPKMEGTASPPRYLAMTPGVRNVLLADLRGSASGRRGCAVVLVACAAIAVLALTLRWDTNFLVGSGLAALVAVSFILGSYYQGDPTVRRDLEEGRFCRVSGPVRFEEDEDSEWVQVGEYRAGWDGGLTEFRELKDCVDRTVLTVDFAIHTGILLELRNGNGTVLYRHEDHQP